MLRNVGIAAANGVARGSQNKETQNIETAVTKKMKPPGGKVARIAEGNR
jgi:hypothetical protein